MIRVDDDYLEVSRANICSVIFQDVYKIEIFHLYAHIFCDRKVFRYKSNVTSSLQLTFDRHNARAVTGHALSVRAPLSNVHNT